MRKLITPGTVFGKLTVKGLVGPNEKGTLVWLVECSCGKTKPFPVIGPSLRNGHSKSCGCSRSRLRLSTVDGWAANKVLKAYKEGAAKRRLSWCIPDGPFYSLIRKNCHYCGSLPSNYVKRKGHPEFFYSGVDRVDNSIGYIITNIVPCCRICNSMKERLSKSKFVTHVTKIANFQKIEVPYRG